MYFWSACRLPTTAVVWREDGDIASITAIAKATFAIAAGDADLAPTQEPLLSFADPTARATAELAPYKARADLIVVGSPYPARPGAPFSCRVALGPVDRAIDVGPSATADALGPLGPRLADGHGVSRFNVAPPSQQLDAFPDELRVTLEHLSPLAPLVHVALPRLQLSVYVEGGGITGTHPMRADMLWIDTDRQIASVTYRAALSPRDASEIRATILVDRPALQQEPAPLDLLERESPRDEDDLPIETGVVPLPPLDAPPPVTERAASRDVLPFRPAAPGAPPLALTPPPRAPLSTRADDDAPATVPPPPLSPPGALGGPVLAPALVPSAAIPSPPRPGRADLPAPELRIAASPPLAPPDLASLSRTEGAGLHPKNESSRRFEPTRGVRAERLAHDADAVLEGLASASDAAARSSFEARRRRRRRDEGERPPPSSNDVCDLIWLDPSIGIRVRRMADWAMAVRDRALDRGWLGAEESLEESRAAADRRVVMRALARVTPAEVSTLPRLLAESIDDDGVVARPLLVVAGELSLPPDPHDVLKASIELANPFTNVEADKPAAAPSRLKAAIDAAGEPRSAGTEAPIARIRQAFGALPRGFPTDYLENTVEQTLLEERRYRKRELFGGDHVWCQIQAGTGTPTTIYLPEEAATRLPLAQRVRVRALAEPHPVQNRADGDGPVLRALAIARVIAQRER